MIDEVKSVLECGRFWCLLELLSEFIEVHHEFFIIWFSAYFRLKWWNNFTLFCLWLEMMIIIYIAC